MPTDHPLQVFFPPQYLALLLPALLLVIGLTGIASVVTYMTRKEQAKKKAA
ncbi:hypothetical protein EON63_19960 [archaeon]|nr:MAG: hypothetical protein EON63_19960 [archaeon]